MSQPELPAIQVGVNPQPRPDGSVWVELQIATPLNFFSVAFPVEQAEEMAEKLPGAFADVAQECKRQMSGIVIANEVPKEK